MAVTAFQKDMLKIMKPRKEVVYFLAKYTDAKPCVVRQNEVRALKSLKLEEAIDIIKHDNKKELLKQADAYIKLKYTGRRV